ncbi:hypothetical protein GCM10010174_24970 [Kutzneria viridogrisea]
MPLLLLTTVNQLVGEIAAAALGAVTRAAPVSANPVTEAATTARFPRPATTRPSSLHWGMPRGGGVGDRWPECNDGHNTLSIHD